MHNITCSEQFKNSNNRKGTLTLCRNCINIYGIATQTSTATEEWCERRHPLFIKRSAQDEEVALIGPSYYLFKYGIEVSPHNKW